MDLELWKSYGVKCQALPPPPLSSMTDHQSCSTTTAAASTKSSGVFVSPSSAHDGYVRLVSCKGRSFPTAFTRPTSCVIENIVRVKKRRRTELCGGGDRIDSGELTTPDVTDVVSSETFQRRRTITEERLHLEEALFLHMRGLLKIERNHSEQVMTTKDLFAVLKDCRVPIPVYLAYAHLRAQGYILTRYTKARVELLCDVMKYGSEDSERTADKVRERQGEVDIEKLPRKDDFVIEETVASITGQNHVAVLQPAQEDPNDTGAMDNPCKRLTADIARAPPPRVSNLGALDASSLSYYAYSPNALFRRTNPGMPDFAVAIAQFHSDVGPTFDSLKRLVDTSTLDGLPLRVVAVADSGVVVVLGAKIASVPSLPRE